MLEKESKKRNKNRSRDEDYLEAIICFRKLKKKWNLG